MEAILAVMNITQWWKKNSGLYGIWTHDLYDTGVALYQLKLTSQLGAGHYVGSK